MKTIEEAAKECAGHVNTIPNIKIFKKGVEFTQRWIPVEEELPENDDRVIAKWNNGKFHVNRYDQISGWQYQFDLIITVR